MSWLSVVLLLYAVHYITCTEQDEYLNKDKGLLFDAFPMSTLSFTIHTKDIQQQTTQVPDKMECIFACIGVPWCQSVNFQTTAQNNGLHVCELLSTDKHTHPKNMTQNSTFTHLSIKNPCEQQPCLNGGTCIPQNNRQDYRCNCTEGFNGDNCQNDVNECTAGTQNCHTTLATCTNTVGSFTCQCKPGYQGNGVTCSDVNECTAGTHNCHTTGATCTNTVGSFTCQCKPGYQGNGVTCLDVNECTTGTHNCHTTLATCTNTAGSFTCQCNSGYQGNGVWCLGPDDCEFEVDMCSWTSDPQNTFKWIRKRLQTPSISTGPNGDATARMNGGGYYVFTEASYGATNQKTELTSPIFPATSGRCLKFAYHMYGSTMGSLKVYAENAQTGAKILYFSKSGNQGQQWYRASLTITCSYSYKVVFEVTKGSSFYGDAALDDIYFKNGDCTP